MIFIFTWAHIFCMSFVRGSAFSYTYIHMHTYICIYIYIHMYAYTYMYSYERDASRLTCAQIFCMRCARGSAFWG